MAAARRRSLSVSDHVAGVRAADRAILARTITLLESRRPADQARAREVLDALLPHTGGAHRVGITGVPGVGKSTFIETLGLRLVDAGRRVAVLAVDPTSQRTGGSILGDKTRMNRLSRHPDAFIRPSPTAGTLGGVAARTREVLLLCEAAGYDVVLVESVGVGQSEVNLASMVDAYLVLMLAGAGDELQGIKRGVLELADLVAINKADGDNRAAAERAAADFRRALQCLAPPSPGWRPPVLCVSALEDEGVAELWAELERHRRELSASGELARKRRGQQVRWLWAIVEDRLLHALRTHPEVRATLAETEAAVEAGRLAPGTAAEHILRAFARPARIGEEGACDARASQAQQHSTPEESP